MNPVGFGLALVGMVTSTFAAYAWRQSLPRHERPSILQMRRLRLSYGPYTKLFWIGTAIYLTGFWILLTAEESAGG